jgi:hypothetical protein
MHGRNAPRVEVAAADLEDERNRRRMTPAAASITPASPKALQISLIWKLPVNINLHPAVEPRNVQTRIFT